MTTSQLTHSTRLKNMVPRENTGVAWGRGFVIFWARPARSRPPPLLDFLNDRLLYCCAYLAHPQADGKESKGKGTQRNDRGKKVLGCICSALELHPGGLPLSVRKAKSVALIAKSPSPQLANFGCLAGAVGERCAVAVFPPPAPGTLALDSSASGIVD